MIDRPTPGSPRPATAPRRVRGAALAVLVLLAGACSGPPPPSGPVVGVTLRDYHIALSAPRADPGTVSFSLHSLGPTTHEFLVARTDLDAGALPLGPNGITVDEDGTSVHVVGEEPAIDLGASVTFSVKLRPGHYVLFCNMEGHYLAGMRASFTVG